MVGFFGSVSNTPEYYTFLCLIVVFFQKGGRANLNTKTINPNN